MKLQLLPRFSKGLQSNKASELAGDIFTFGKKKELDPEDTNFRKRLHQNAQVGGQRLLDVFNAHVVPLAPDFIAPVFIKSKEDQKFIQDALSGALLFENMSKYERKEIVNAFEKHAVPKDTVLIKEGDRVEYFYIIKSGTVDGPDGEMSSSEFFGDLSLLYDYPSDATYKATSDCVLWRLGQATFRMAMAAYAHRGDKETMKLLKRVDLFREIDDETLTKVASSLSIETYEKGQVIVHKGETQLKKLFIIKEGSVKCTDIVIGTSKYDDVTLDTGQSFGEAAVFNGTPTLANVTALEDVTMAVLPKEIFTKLFGGMTELVQRSQDKKLLMALPKKTKLKVSVEELELLVPFIKNVEFVKGHTFFREGFTADQSIFLLRSGSVSAKSSALGPGFEGLVGIFGYETAGDETVITEGGYFGIDTIKPPEDQSPPGPAKYTITAREPCRVGVLARKDIMSVITKLEEGRPIPFDDLKKYRILGAGTFGKVWLVSQVGTKDAYALKVQSKRKTIECGQVEGVIREKNAMTRLDHPFIIKLVSSYKDERSLYMLMELYQGGELRSVISTHRRIGVPEDVARFYAANMLQGLSYMHKRHVLHRDLKPENVLLNNNGYTVLVDLGFARVVTGKTYTFCGTPVYIAPEVIRQRGYDNSCDIWSFAVMVYEMIVGITPFYDHGMRQQELFRKILEGKFSFPRGSFMSEESRDLLTQMMQVDPRRRLGCLAEGHQGIRKHPWFRSVDFEAIEKMQAQVPWEPNIKDPFDDRNFEKWDHLDKEEDEEPLSAREERLFAKF